jgi:streptogramin lyase
MRIALGALSLISVVVLSGCISTRIGSNTQINPLHGASLQGKVHGGENPVVGANVYLYAANTTGYGSASVSLLDSPGYVTTDSNGNFSITGDYTCPNANSQVYLYAIGGNPGLAQGTNNSAAGMLAGLGSCGSLKSSTVVIVNEVSTIATAYAIAGYAVDATHVSSSGSTLAQTGVANAFAAIPNLEQVTTTGGVTSFTGIANTTTPAGNGTVPQAEINTLANILAACTNSTGAVTGPTNATPCYTLFTNAESGGTTGTQPADTATAAINIAHNPACYLGFEVCSLIALQTANSPFQPQLTAAPNDFTVSIIYASGGVHSAQGLAIDSIGDVWFASLAGNFIGELNPAGKLISGTLGYVGGGLANPQYIAIDASGNVWATNSTGGVSISELSSTGVAISGSSGYTGGGLISPAAIAIDTSGNAWVTNTGTNTGTYDLSEFNSSGSPISGSSGYTGGGLGEPDGIAIDVSGDVWVANVKANTGISEFSSAGSPISGSTAFGGGPSEYIEQPQAIALDGAGNIWVTNSVQSIAELGSNGTVLSPGIGYTGGGISNPIGIAIDGSGNVWAANLTGNSISELNSSGATISPAYSGYEAGERYLPYAIAIDGSGNVWVGGNAIIEYVGAAAPVVTPIVANLLPPYAQHAVNMP